MNVFQRHKMSQEKKPEKIKISKLSNQPIESETLYGVFIKIYEKNGIFSANYSRKINQLKTREAFHNDSQKFNFGDIKEVVEHFGVDISFWFSPKYSKKHKNQIVLPVKIKSFSPKSDPILSVHLLLAHKNDEINLKTSNLSVVIDEAKFFEFLNRPLNFWTCVSSKLNISEESARNKWPKTFVRFHDERKFFDIFGIGFSIWELKSVLKDDTNNVQQNIIYQSAFPEKNFILQSFNENWDFEKTEINEQDRFCLANEKSFEVFRCPNDFCGYADTLKTNFLRHVKTCTNETNYNFSQVNKKDAHISDWLISEGYLKSKPNPKEFIAFDIETCGNTDARIISDHTDIKSSFKIATIAVTKSSGESHVFVRESSSEEGYIKVVSDFFTFLLKFRDQYRENLPAEVNNAFFKIKEILFRKKEDPNYVKLAPKYHGNLKKAYNYLGKIREAKVIGFNSESFDLPVLVPAFFKAWTSKYFRDLNKNEKIPRDPKPHDIQRGSGHLTIGFLGVRFLDMYNFFTTGSLATAGRVFNIQDEKLLFPYEKYTSVEEMKSDTNFPPYIDFRSTLCLSNDSFDISKSLNEAYHIYKTNTRLEMPESLEHFEKVMQIDLFTECNINDDEPTFTVIENSDNNFPYCPIKYIKNLFLFEELKKLGKISNMLNYLAYYNQADTILTMQAFKKMLESFIERFSVNLTDFYSIPSVSGHLLWEKFDQTIAAPYSISPKFNFLGHRFRKACDGGLSSPKHRHIAVGDQSRLYPDCVGKAPNGQPFVLGIGLDVNSLYPFCKTQDLPVGPGYFYEKKTSGKFQWSSMKTKDVNWSLIAIEWLNYRNSMTPFKTQQKMHHISHALNHGEKKINMGGVISYPDGYCELDGVKYYFYYHGCRFHYHKDCSVSESANIFNEQREKDDKIRNWCTKNGVYIEIFDCEWRILRKTVQFKNLSSCFFNHPTLIGEDEILKKVESGDFFGCLEIDIESPPETVEHFKKLNWPPIYTKIDVDETMVQPKLLKNIRNYKTTKQLTQVFNAKNYLLTTDMYLFYKSKGMKFRNLTFAVEYQKAKPLKNFVDELVKCRIAADKANQPEMVSLFKLILNSSYGYLLLNKSKVRSILSFIIQIFLATRCQVRENHG